MYSIFIFAAKIMKAFSNKIINNKYFEKFIILVILVNCILIGVETYYINSIIILIQNLALIIFTIEIILRWFARNSTKLFFSDGWNVFDLFIVLISYIPESLLENTTMITALRILRVFRIFRLLRAFPDLRLMTEVFIRSVFTMLYNGAFFVVFLYLYAVIGISLFKLPHDSDNPIIKEKLSIYMSKSPNAPSNSPDPYGTLGETMFTLFRILTGEDWTDLRYNLVFASKLGLIKTSEQVVTIYHVSWFIIATFLILNLLVGAILNNYNTTMEQLKQEKLKNKEKNISTN